MAAVFEERGPAYVSVGDVFTSPPLPKSWPMWGEATDSLNSVFPGFDFSGLVFGAPGLELGLEDPLSLAPKLGMGFPSIAMKESVDPRRLETFQEQTEGDKGNSKDLLKRQLQKTQLCMFWKRNCCAKGSDCTFAHSVEELKELPDLRRTSLCKQWLKGRCPQSAATCRYAHGEAYLRRTFEDAQREARRRKGGPSKSVYDWS